MKLLVSACLLGIGCKYSGRDNLRPELLEQLRRAGHTLIPVCPEIYGGLPTPRPPAERRNGRVMTETGADVTAAEMAGEAAAADAVAEVAVEGAETALELYRRCGCEAALLKAKSPSCGSGVIYDGTFSHTKIAGDGVTAELLKSNGIPVYTEEDCAPLIG